MVIKGYGLLLTIHRQNPLIFLPGQETKMQFGQNKQQGSCSAIYLQEKIKVAGYNYVRLS
jgi:hypothetical protein